MSDLPISGVRLRAVDHCRHGTPVSQKCATCEDGMTAEERAEWNAAWPPLIAPPEAQAALDAAKYWSPDGPCPHGVAHGMRCEACEITAVWLGRQIEVAERNHCDPDARPEMTPEQRALDAAMQELGWPAARLAAHDATIMEWRADSAVIYFECARSLIEYHVAGDEDDAETGVIHRIDDPATSLSRLGWVLGVQEPKVIGRFDGDILATADADMHTSGEWGDYPSEGPADHLPTADAGMRDRHPDPWIRARGLVLGEKYLKPTTADADMPVEGSKVRDFIESADKRITDSMAIPGELLSTGPTLSTPMERAVRRLLDRGSPPATASVGRAMDEIVGLKPLPEKPPHDDPPHPWPDPFWKD